MKRIVILGGGTAGTMMASHLIKRLKDDWKIIIIEPKEDHYYQPGFLFMPFGVYKEKDIVKKNRSLFPKKVDWVKERVANIDHQNNSLLLKNNEKITYDILIIATGSHTVPQETEGLLGDLWQKSIFDFYTPEGAIKLHKALTEFTGGDIAVHITEMPIKCPVAPLEFAFLLDSYLAKKRKIRNKTKITFVTPLSGAFTKPVASKILGHLLEEKNIHVVADFNIEKVDNQKKCIVSYDGREVSFDLLVTVPTNMGAKLIEDSEIGDELNFVPTDKATLQAEVKENIFVLGDSTNLPTSKAGSVAHFEAEILIENILDYINDREFSHNFDGHANCFIESGYGKAFLIDFNYLQEPVTGRFPLPKLGPLSLLKKSRLNHLGKMSFKWIYWNMLLKAKKIPLVGATMKFEGKNIKGE